MCLVLFINKTILLNKNVVMLVINKIDNRKIYNRVDNKIDNKIENKINYK